MPLLTAPSCAQFVDQEDTRRRLKKRVTIFLRARSGRSPCCGKQFAHLKTKSPLPNRAERRRRNQKLPRRRAKLPNQVCRRNRRPPRRRQAKCSRFSLNGGAASISKRRGVV